MYIPLLTYNLILIDFVRIVHYCVTHYTVMFHQPTKRTRSLQVGLFYNEGTIVFFVITITIDQNV